jgi:HD-like signal output (HDOD) protein
MEDLPSTGTHVGDLALVVCEEGKAEKALAGFLEQLLNYRYGIETEQVAGLTKVKGVLRRRGDRICCCFVIQRQSLTARSAVPVLTANGTIPLFLILPGSVTEAQRKSSSGIRNVFVCPWEQAYTTGPGSLPHTLVTNLPQTTVILGGERGTAEMEELVSERLDNLDTLPTLPSIVTHIMRLVGNPKTTIKELEDLLSSDPAIVLKVVQVANSAVFAGTTSNRRWTLNEAIVRLGLRKIGAIGQQIALINSFVRPEDSDFDMMRFWQHSVGCALLAERLVEGGHVRLSPKVEFNEYWIAALLHDCGKLVQGFFFHEWFERILATMDENNCSFHAAEFTLAEGTVSHELIGDLLLRKSQMPRALTRAVRRHHVVGEPPAPLTCLVHVTNNMANEIGLGYTKSLVADYNRVALDKVKLRTSDVENLRNQYAESVVYRVKELVDQCMS